MIAEDYSELLFSGLVLGDGGLSIYLSIQAFSEINKDFLRDGGNRSYWGLDIHASSIRDRGSGMQLS